jgi:lipopolysaccharide transport system ATP-binding protein
MTTNSAIAIRGISKKFRLFASPKQRLYEALHPLRKQYYREFWALRDVSFSVAKGEIVGILGRNGSGKSTLLQIICAVMSATEGDVQVNGKIAALLELGAGFNPEFSGRENVILNGAIMGFSRSEMVRRMADIEAFADIGEFFDQPVKTYSSGMFVRVAFSAAIHVDPEILIVDEALSVGDATFQHRCFQRIRAFMEQGKTILIVSHNTDTLLRICHRGIVIDGGQLDYEGKIEDAVNRYAELLYSRKNSEHKRSDPGATDELENAPLARGSRNSLNGLDHTDRVSEMPIYNEHETRLGNGAAQIIAFDIIVEGVENPEQIGTHKRVELVVKLLFHEDLDDVSIGFAVVTIDGTYVFGTNLESLNLPLFAGKSGSCVAVRFRWRSHFTGGEQFLNIGCHQFRDGEVTYLDVRRSVAKIKFAETPGITGFVDLEVESEIEELIVA